MLKSIVVILISALCIGGAEAPGFAVVSIHPQAPDDSSFSVHPPAKGEFSATGITARLLTMLAYDVQESQIAGGSDWFGTEKWTIQAKSDDGAAHSDEETRRMLQKMLEERFALRIHRETRERPAYVLMVAKNGPKLKTPEHAGGLDVRVNANSISIQRGELSRMTQLLSGVLGRPVIDRTGLKGIYNFSLQWDDAPIADGGVIGTTAPATPGTDRGSIFSAIQDQLGLRLVSQRAPVETIVIDRIEKPSEN